jgi:hypothetical protein
MTGKCPVSVSAAASGEQCCIPWLKKPGAAETALDELAKDRGSWQYVATTAKGGRPSRVFTLSTPSTVSETTAKPEENEGFVDVDSVDAHEDKALTSESLESLFDDPMPDGPYSERL